MPRLINLGPLFVGRRIISDLLDRQGIGYFTLAESDGPSFRLDPTKLDGVMEMACRDAEHTTPHLPLDEADLCHCRRLLRRELIHELALGMVQAGF